MDMQTVLAAMKNAEAAGNYDDARTLARLAQRMQAEDPEQRTRELQQKLIDLQSRKPEVQTTIGGNVKEAFKGVVPGAIGLLETAGTGISALLPDETEKSVRGTIKDVASAAKKPFEAAPGYEESVGRRLGEGLGSTLPFFAAGPLGLAGRVAAGGVGVAAGAGEAREAAEAKGATGSERRAATLLGAPTGLLDIIAPEIGPMKSIITTALARGGVEGATEAAQKLAQNLIAKGVYDPSQPVLAGTGEEGAYGAGVGAMASLILDLTLGRRARGARTTEPGAEDTSTTGTPPAGPTAARPQGELFPAELDAAQRELESVMGPQRPAAEEVAPAERTAAEAGQMSLFEGEAGPSELETTQPDLFGEIVPKREEVTARDVEEPTPERDTRTRDMIDELETADIERMVAEDTTQPAKADAEKQRLKFESDLAELDGRIKAKEEKTTEDNRLALLLPIIESNAKNIPAVAVDTFKRAGFTNPNLTEREQRLIQRAYDVRLAEPVAPEVEPSAPAENAAMEALIPEKKTTREPEQMGIPGIGKRTGPAPQAFSEEELAAQEKPFATKLTADVLDQSGLPKQSGLYKQLLGMDMADRNQWPALATIFARVRTNPGISAGTKAAFDRLAMQAFGGVATQQEMFGPRGGVITPKEKPSGAAKAGSKDKGADSAATGAGAQRSESGGAEDQRTRPAADTKRAEAPKPAGVGTRVEPAADTGSGKAVESGALKEAPKAETKKAATKAEPKAELRVEPKKTAPARTAETSQGKGLPLGGENAYQTAKDNGETDHAIRTLAADAYLNSAEDYSVQRAQQMIKDLEDGKVPDLKFGKNNANGPGTGGKYAEAFYKSLNKEEQAQFRKELQDFLYQEIKTKGFLDAYNRSQEIARADTGVDDTSALNKDLNVVATPLHPEAVRMLKSNDLLGALRFVGNQNLGKVSALANALADKLSGVDVEVVDFAKPNATLKAVLKMNPQAANAAGMFATLADGRRVILLNSNTGLDLWTLLHEAHHPLIDATLNNPSHPLTKQLTELYNSVKDSLDTAYGATDVKEFAAEARSNPEFQRKLAAINPKGEKFTAWQRFVHAVKNFMRSVVGLPPKGMDSALDSADRMIEAIVNGHDGTSNSLETVSLLNKGAAFFDAMGQRAESLPGLNEERVARIHEMLTGTIPTKFKDVIRQALPLNALVDVAKKYIPMAPRLDVLVGERSGAENKRNQMIEPIISRVEGWAKNNAGKLDAFNSVVYNSTLAQVDPSKPRSEYVGKTDSSGNKKDAEWDKLQAAWKEIGPEGQSVYKQMRDTYQKMYEDVRDVLNARIDSSVEDKGTANKVKTEIYQRLFASGSIEPYFPLTRTGKHWLSYNLGNEFFVEAYETSYERDKAIKELNAEGATDVQKFANLNQVNYRKAPATSFVNNVLRTLEANKVNPNVTEEVMRMFLNTLPETSFAQGFRRRKGTLGFKHDAIGALRSKAFNLSRQLSNMEYGAKLEKLRAEMKDYVRTQGNQEPAVDMMNELDARIDYAISPQVPMWSKLATSFGFNMTLGFNVSSALVNLSQIPLVVMPYLGGKYGYAATTKAVGRAAKYFVGSGFDREVEMLVPTDKGEKKMKVRAFPSMDNYDFSKADAPKHLETLAKMAAERGQLNRSQIYDVLDVGEDTGMLTKINAASGFVFHHGERMNRQVSLIAAYELELEKLAGKDLSKATEQQRIKAAEEALYMTELTNGGTAAAAAPRLAQSALGKVLFMYKRYGASMYYMLFKTAREALKSADPDVRKAAKRQIAGIYASSALMAGVQGIPMFGIAAMMYNLFKDDDEDDFDTAARKYLGEGVYSGAINALSGLEIAGRIGLSDLLFRDANTRPSDSVMLSLMETAGGPVVGSVSRVERGLKLIADGDVERGIEQMLPSAFGNMMKSVRYATEGAKTLRGDPIIGEVGPWNVGAQFFGFAPAEYTRQLEINSDLKSLDRDTLERRTKMLRKYYVAMRNGDASEAASVLEDMMKFSKRHPSAAITGETIQNSMAQHMRTTQEMYHGITLSRSMRDELLQRASEYED